VSLAAGVRIGPYEIMGSLGAGGMGEVYRAVDTRLNRTVAIKVLPADVSGDPDRRERFEREAQAIGALNHPHICTLYDVATFDGVFCLVMEHLEGETLADRLERFKDRPLQVNEGLQIAVQIADALDRAHRAGIIHRDIKPANVFLVRRGGATAPTVAKLLDFGLAKAAAPPVAANVSLAPTTPAALTAQGTIVGTFQYMAPEQIEGAEADVRTDIFAFGCVLYEMLAGRKAFEGKTTAGVMAAILKDHPPLASASPALSNPALEFVVRRCLAKNPDDRWQSAGDLKMQLAWILESGPQSAIAAAPSAPAPTRKTLPWAIAGLAVAAAMLGGAILLRSQPQAPRTARLSMSVAPADSLNGSVAVSPDGTRIAFEAVGGGKVQLYVRRIDDATATAIYTGGVSSLAFSPDGQWIAFGDDTRLKKIAVGGGAPVDVCAIGRGGAHGIAWISNDTIVFSSDSSTGDRTTAIRRVSANGGESSSVTEADAAAGEGAHSWPVAVPGGQAVLFASQNRTSPTWSDADVGLVSLDTGRRRVVVPRGGIPIRVLPSGHLLLRRRGTVFAVPFDPSRGEIRGSQIGVVEDVRFELQLGIAVVDVSDTGLLVFAQGLFGDQERSLVLVGPNGATAAGTIGSRAYYDPRVSPNGQRIAVEVADASDDIWVGDLQRGTMTRLTFDADEDETPVWSPDGKWIAYSSSKPGQPRTVFRKAADGSGVEETVWTSAEHSHVEDWSRDGRTILVSVDAGGTHNDIWAVPLDGATKARPLIQTKFAESNARLSPDGRWIAYQSDESGRDEVYVQRFPSLDSKAQVSTEGGREPVWSRDGRALFYRGVRGVMEVPVSAGEMVQLGTPKALGEDVYTHKGGPHTGYDATEDGRLVFARDGQQQAATKYLAVIDNWFPELLRRVPVK